VQPEPPSSHGRARRRVVVAAAIGAATGVVASVIGATWSASFLFASDAFSTVYLAWIWTTIAPMDAKGTERLALSEDDSRAAADAVILGASVASLVAIVFTLAEAKKSSGGDAVLLAALALGSIVLGWASIHTTFTLMYARLYYSPPSGGIDFPDGDPDYRDFAYTAFTIGMTYQVSDTGVTQKRVRQVVVRHAFLSFIFGTTIIAVAINAVANLIQ
jgi:uncharacterized membrane protein